MHPIPKTLLALAAMLPALPAQPMPITATLPTSTFWLATNEPFAGQSPKRYQQWFSPAAWQTAVGRPMRVVGLDFFAGTPGGQTGASIDIQITMANGPLSFPTTNMTTNLASGAVVVVPRSQQTLNTATPGTMPLSISFKQFGTEFVWDGSSAVVVDILVFNNGKGNQPYRYDLQATFSSTGQVYRLWGFGADPRAVTQSSFFQNGAGLAMQFTLEDGVSVPFGRGCAGAGGAVPLADTTGGLPLSGNPSWTHTLANANSQVGTALILGGSRTQFMGLPLPLNLAPLAPACDLLNNFMFSIPTQTVGGGPGSGLASVPLPIPPVTQFVGQSLFAQWLVIDPGAFGNIAMSNGIWTVFG